MATAWTGFCSWRVSGLTVSASRTASSCAPPQKRPVGPVPGWPRIRRVPDRSGSKSASPAVCWGNVSMFSLSASSWTRGSFGQNHVAPRSICPPAVGTLGRVRRLGHAPRILAAQHLPDTCGLTAFTRDLFRTRGLNAAGVFTPKPFLEHTPTRRQSSTTKREAACSQTATLQNQRGIWGSAARSPDARVPPLLAQGRRRPLDRAGLCAGPFGEPQQLHGPVAMGRRRECRSSLDVRCELSVEGAR